MDPSLPTAMVFSHPSHELAVFGLVQHLAPQLVILTDGGRHDRMQETRRGLESIGLSGRARFLEYSEAAIYDALLAGDAHFFEGMASRLRDALEPMEPARVLCDAVEFYNPVHDVTLPVVRAALRGRPEVQVFEVPLIHECAGEPDRFEVQRLPAADPRKRLRRPLAPAEMAAKRCASDDIYSITHGRLEPVRGDLPGQTVGDEEIAAARSGVPEPSPGQGLRYERRGRLLQEQGAVEHVITWADHYRPLAASLMQPGRS